MTTQGITSTQVKTLLQILKRSNIEQLKDIKKAITEKIITINEMRN